MLPYNDELEHSPTIHLTDLAEGYRHKYKTYWFLSDEKGQFIQKLSSKEQGESIKKKCGCLHWKISCSREPERVLQERTTTNRFQYQGTHKDLTFSKKDRELELAYDRKEQARMNAIHRKTEHAQEKKRSLQRMVNNESLFDLNPEIMQEIKIEQAEQELRKFLMG
jgi:hypothetical protein